MPRTARKKSNSGIYHIMLRGINRQIIFEDDEDRVKYIDTLKHYKQKCGFDFFAYCPKIVIYCQGLLNSYYSGEN